MRINDIFERAQTWTSFSEIQTLVDQVRSLPRARAVIDTEDGTITIHFQMEVSKGITETGWLRYRAKPKGLYSSQEALERRSIGACRRQQHGTRPRTFEEARRALSQGFGNGALKVLTNPEAMELEAASFDTLRY